MNAADRAAPGAGTFAPEEATADRTPQHPPGAAASWSLPPAEELHLLLSAGLRAPSAENRHAMRFEPRGDAVLLRATDTALWVGQPHRELLDRLALGTVVENIALRSAARGWQLQHRWQPAGSDSDIVARLTWRRVPDAAAGEAARTSLALDRAIEQRHTHRGFYRRAPLPAATLDAIVQAAADVPGARLHWLDAPAQRRLALRALNIAERERFRRPALHRELFSAIDFKLGWRASSDEGLAPSALQVELPARAPFALMRHWPLMRASHWLGGHHALALRAAVLPCALSPHLGLLTIEGDGAVPLLEGGRALQRLWLAAASQGVALQPMAATTALLAQQPGDGWVDARAQSRLRALVDELLAGARTENLERAACALMFVRLGSAGPATGKSGRRPLSQYMG